MSTSIAAELELFGPQVALGRVLSSAISAACGASRRQRRLDVLGHRGGRRRIEHDAIAAQQHRRRQPTVVARHEHAERGPLMVPLRLHARCHARRTARPEVRRGAAIDPAGREVLELDVVRLAGTQRRAIRDRARHRQQHVGIRRQRAAGSSTRSSSRRAADVRAQVDVGLRRAPAADLDAHDVGLGGRRAQHPRAVFVRERRAHEQAAQHERDVARAPGHSLVGRACPRRCGDRRSRRFSLVSAAPSSNQRGLRERPA